jgi:hypothetical protein
MTARRAMAGGGAAESVPPHDLAIIIGAVGLLGALFIFTWAQPMVVDFDAGGGVVEVAQLKVGILGSNDELVVTWQQTEFCEEVNVTCSLQRIRVLDESGSVIAETQGEDAAEDPVSADIPIDGSGEYTIELVGRGQYDVSVSVNRQLPIQFLPPALCLLLLTWGVWRRFQEPSKVDDDISAAVDELS